MSFLISSDWEESLKGDSDESGFTFRRILMMLVRQKLMIFFSSIFLTITFTSINTVNHSPHYICISLVSCLVKFSFDVSF